MKILIFRKPKKWFKIWLSKCAYQKLEKTIILEFLNEDLLLSDNMEKGNSTFSKCAGVFNAVIRHKIHQLEGKD